MASSCNIELARFSARLRIQDEAECGTTAVQKYDGLKKKKVKLNLYNQNQTGRAKVLVLILSD